MRKAPVFLAFLSVQIFLLAWFASPWAPEATTTALAANRTIVRVLGLTDFSIWTEARYTRHPSQADRFSAHQDFPSALEHFPAGSLVSPPALFEAPIRRNE